MKLLKKIIAAVILTVLLAAVSYCLYTCNQAGGVYG